MKKNFSTFMAFTLAEVLIVIGIIGVIANMTVPTLVAKTEKQTWVTSFKKFNSQFTNGLKTYMAKEGCYDLACTGLFEGKMSSSSALNAWETNANKVIRSAFKVAKNCNTRNNGCHTDEIKNLNKTSTYNSFYYGHSFQTADGYTFMLYDTEDGNCTYNSSVTTSSKLKNYCGSVYVDVNGDKKPNIWGRDIFVLLIGRDGSLYPMGGAETAKLEQEDYTTAPTYWKNNTICGTSGSATIPAGATGTNCSARIIESGWIMDY